MSLMTRLMGAAVIAVSGLTAAPVHAEGGTLVIASSQVPRHLNGAVQSGIATAVPSTQIFASPCAMTRTGSRSPIWLKAGR